MWVGKNLAKIRTTGKRGKESNEKLKSKSKIQ
jgi:hypothetical protein